MQQQNLHKRCTLVEGMLVKPLALKAYLPFEIATHIPLHLPIRPSVRERSELKYVCIGVVAVTRSTAVAYDERVEPKQSGRLWAAEVAAVSLRFGCRESQ